MRVCVGAMRAWVREGGQAGCMGVGRNDYANKIFNP